MVIVGMLQSVQSQHKLVLADCQYNELTSFLQLETLCIMLLMQHCTSL
jgi:hypothetical protein